ncbi:MAG: class I tRNA ligase family protein [Candidatus Pacearchaeota archaeon]|nr:class I tRNA ligase family protein [Candidatus Pacearchaeota archaeon]
MESKKKYTVNVAYTTPSGRMHIGHGLGHTISDVALRYGALRQRKDTFFGFGMHSTGKDLIKIISKLGERDQLSETLKQYNLSRQKRDEITSRGSLKEQVDELVKEYRKQYQEVIERLGVAMNYDSFFSTHQEANQRYTQWTLRRLAEKGLIVETESDRPYCPKCDDIKHIDKDLSEVSAVGKVNWDEVRIEEGMIRGGDFECRLHSGEKIIVKRRKERAINYGDPQMQQKTIELAKRMEVFPKKYKPDLENIIRTRLAKPFERKAHENVGAISPFDQTKSVEALSDSNIYMEFYAISQLINRGKLKSENLTDSFFDYIYIGKGDADIVARESRISKEILEETREHVNDTYPVDISVAGFEHLSVHMPFSLFTHAAVLPEKYFFPGYIVTSHITRDGEKMSKSKGNVVYLDELLDLTKIEGKLNGLSDGASLDAVRFFLSYYQSLDKDFDWNDDNFKSSGIKGMRRYVTGITEAANLLKGLEGRTLEPRDKWFSTVDQRTVQEITEKMDEKDSRGALVTLVDIRGKALSAYLSPSNPNQGALSRFLLNQINMGYPVMPRVTDELRKMYFNDSKLEWPSAKPDFIFPEPYEIIEHQMKGRGYEKNLSGEINALLGRMFGRHEIGIGETVTVVTPTAHQIEVLHNQKISLSEKFNIKFLVDPLARGITIKK